MVGNGNGGRGTPGQGSGAKPGPSAAATSISCDSAAFAELSAEILRTGKALRFRARGASMAPLVRDGDVLLVQPLDDRSARFGDVVLCSGEPGRVLVHRIIGTSAGPDGTRFVVQGDQAAGPDGTVPAAQIYGRVGAIERGGAHIDMDGPAMRLLGWAAALRSRWGFGRGRPSRLAGQVVRRLPVLSRYLA